MLTQHPLDNPFPKTSCAMRQGLANIIIGIGLRFDSRHKSQVSIKTEPA
jgi:hypothetical protein